MGARANRPGVTTRLTTGGRVLVPVALFGLFAAWAEGGLVGLFAATAVVLLALAPLATRLHLAGVRVGAPPPVRVHVGDAFLLRLPVSNRAARLHARHLTIACSDGEADDLRAGQAADLSPGEERAVAVTHRLHARGRHRTLDVFVSSSFPLGLVRRTVRFRVPADLLALPRLGSLRDLRRLPAGVRDPWPAARVPRHGDEELYAVRDWREGESLRRVHWRLSARRGRRIVREMRDPNEPPVHVVLAIGAPPRLPIGAPRRAFERSVSLAATVGEHYLRRGREVRWTLAGDELASRGPVRGRAGLLSLLTSLAEVRSEEQDAAGVDRALARALERPSPRASRLRDELVVAVCSGLAPSGAAGGPSPSLGAGVVVLDVDDPATGDMFHEARRRGTELVRGGA